ncbi:hypothetical protein GBF35_29505 [Nonomuraea phyllanthi]|uniref:hypothetical protein n=1 Tax=Nonomuraea phyllanthi TaxID=2219224 RepID=UPI00129337F3|nr:hypothetical protein [Nonomuraea phyllanthi]QFY10217.1 hypothetical protein GBF35_29505 [Nonomuraea phyllanthi]
MTAFAGHQGDGGGESLALLLRPGNAGSSTAAAHLATTHLALAQPPSPAAARVSAMSMGPDRPACAPAPRPGHQAAPADRWTAALPKPARAALPQLPAAADGQKT